jgi:hypothetical protein
LSSSYGLDVGVYESAAAASGPAKEEVPELLRPSRVKPLSSSTEEAGPALLADQSIAGDGVRAIELAASAVQR